MLPNTVSVPIAPAATPMPHNLSLVDVDNGRSVRKLIIDSANEITLTIAQMATNENKPVGTRRTTVRFDHVKTLADGSQRNAFVQLIIGAPKSADFTQTDILNLVNKLVGMLLGNNTATDGSWLSASSWNSTTSPGYVLVNRLLTGEV